MSHEEKSLPSCFTTADHHMASYIVGSFSSDDSDGKEDVKKSNRFVTQNDNFARASRFFVHFFTVVARLRRESA